MCSDLLEHNTRFLQRTEMDRSMQRPPSPQYNSELGVGKKIDVLIHFSLNP